MLPIVLMYTIGRISLGLVRIQIIAVNRKNQETASARQMFLNHLITFSCGYFENNFSKKFIIVQLTVLYNLKSDIQKTSIFLHPA